MNTLLLDKTGTITLGNRQAVEFIPLKHVEASELADAAQLSSLADETPEGRSIVVLAKEKYGLRGRELRPRIRCRVYSIYSPDAHERRRYKRSPDRKGASDAVIELGQGTGRHGSQRLEGGC